MSDKINLSDSQKDVNSRDAIIATISALRDNKPGDKSERDRRYAVAITELEKVYAYFYTYVYQHNEPVP